MFKISPPIPTGLWYLNQDTKIRSLTCCFLQLLRTKQNNRKQAFEIITVSQLVAKVIQGKVVPCTLHPFSLTGYILHNYLTIWTPGNWPWHKVCVCRAMSFYHICIHVTTPAIKIHNYSITTKASLEIPLWNYKRVTSTQLLHLCSTLTTTDLFSTSFVISTML